MLVLEGAVGLCFAEMRAHETPETIPWETIERFFFVVALLSKYALFFLRLGVEFGYDVDGHFQAMKSVSWLHPFFDLRSFYYALHPALGFLMTNTIGLLLHKPPLISAQIISFLSAITILWFLRRTLQLLGVLDRPGAIGFLYLVCGSPLFSYLQVAVNLDVIVFAFASIALYASARLLSVEHRRVLCWPVFVIGIAAGCAVLVKQSGLLVLSLPFLFAIVRGKDVWLQVKRLLMISGVFVVMIFPYYLVNYYLPEGTFLFNSAGTFDYVGEYRAGIAKRDADFGKYLGSFFLGHGGNEARLLPTWRALWQAEDFDPQSDTAATYISFYESIMPWLLLCGFLLFLVGLPRNHEWFNFGVVCIGFSLLQVLSLMLFMMLYPIDGYFSNKGIYIASASLGIFFFISLLIEFSQLLPARWLSIRWYWQFAFLSLVLMFLVINTLGPVY